MKNWKIQAIKNMNSEGFKNEAIAKELDIDLNEVRGVLSSRNGWQRRSLEAFLRENRDAISEKKDGEYRYDIASIVSEFISKGRDKSKKKYAVSEIKNELKGMLDLDFGKFYETEMLYKLQLDEKEVKSKNKKDKLVVARHIIWAYEYCYKPYSLEGIGKEYGKSHGAVIAGINSVFHNLKKTDFNKYIIALEKIKN